jgi:eukaryotic-like serine/threonine-protein kinase
MEITKVSMPAVASFLKTVLRSGLLTREQLEESFRQAPEEKRLDPQGLANYLVKAGLLSRFQARKLLEGKTLGLVLGPFQVLAPIGKGGMSTVYLSRDTRSQNLVALKVLPPKKARKEERLLARFLREMELCQRVAHPHLAQTYEVGVSQGVYFIAMEFIPGRSLYRLVNAEGSLSVSRAARLFTEVASALDHAHCRGVIHRDLKPSNVMVTTNDHAKVLDLGLAMIEGEVLTDPTILGGNGYVVGTMDYISPEQSEDAAKVDARSDIYGLGSTLYFTLTGQPPFPGGSAMKKIMRHRNEEPIPVPQLNPTVPSGFNSILQKMMAKRPDDRYQSAEALRKAFLPWVGNEPILPMDLRFQEIDQAEVLHEVEEANLDLIAEAIVIEPEVSPPLRRRKPSLTLYHLPGAPAQRAKLAWRDYLVPIGIGSFIGLVLAILVLLIVG